MPQVARIGAIIFQIFHVMGERHHLPHVKVMYGDDSATFDLNNGNLLSGYLKPSQMRIASKILRDEFNRRKLMQCWNSLNKEYVCETVNKVNLRFS